MNQDNDQTNATEIDPQVSDQYESLADETTPANLDRAVLREATRAVRADNRKGSFGAWFRPVAFMAMVGLSLVIILDLSDTSIFKPVAEMSFEAAPTVQVPPNSTADGPGRYSGQSSLSDIKRQEKLAPAQSLPIDAPDTGSAVAAVTAPGESRRSEQGQLQKMQSELVQADSLPQAEPGEDHSLVSDAFTAEAESVEQRVQKVGAAFDANLRSRPATAAQFSAPRAAVATESFSQPPPPACSDVQKSVVEEWWKCVETLRKSGLAEAADLELANLRDAFPDFELTE